MEFKDEELSIQNVMHVDVEEKNNKYFAMISVLKYY